MPLDRLEIRKSLVEKGFKEIVKGDHKVYHFHDNGLATRARTKMSHGSKYKTLGDDLVSCMARQCMLSNREFRELVECTLSLDGYRSILRTRSNPGGMK